MNLSDWQLEFLSFAIWGIFLYCNCYLPYFLNAFFANCTLLPFYHSAVSSKIVRHFKELWNLKKNWRRSLVEVHQIKKRSMTQTTQIKGIVLVKLYQILKRNMKRSLLRTKAVGLMYILKYLVLPEDS